jgi:hypothetical protein
MSRVREVEAYVDVTLVVILLKNGRKLVMVNGKVETGKTFIVVRREEYSPELRATVANVLTIPRESVEMMYTVTKRISIEQAEELIAKYKELEESTLSELIEE